MRGAHLLCSFLSSYNTFVDPEFTLIPDRNPGIQNARFNQIQSIDFAPFEAEIYSAQAMPVVAVVQVGVVKLRNWPFLSESAAADRLLTAAIAEFQAATIAQKSPKAECT